MAKQQNVPNEHVNEELEKKKSLKYFHGEVGAEAAGEASNAYAPASLVAAGAGEFNGSDVEHVEQLRGSFPVYKSAHSHSEDGLTEKSCSVAGFSGCHWLAATYRDIAILQTY